MNQAVVYYLSWIKICLIMILLTVELISNDNTEKMKKKKIIHLNFILS